MIKQFLVISTIIAVGSASPVLAKPADQPWQAAEADSYTFCFVGIGDVGPYVKDLECTAHYVIKRDESGKVTSFRYQDKGSLQESQTAPAALTRTSLTQRLYGFNCTSVEIVTTSGAYSSNLT